MDFIHKKIFSELFNNGGYVLDFSNQTFGDFTIASIGKDLQMEYRASKGKSLYNFIMNGEEDLVIKLLYDLFEYADTLENKFQYLNENQYNKCWDVLNKYPKNKNVRLSTENIEQKFSSEFLSQQIEEMKLLVISNPTDAIGKAKELIESCCKTILEGFGVEYKHSWNIYKFRDETLKVLSITPEDIPEDIPEAETMKDILGSFSIIVAKLANLRNTYGSGHGKNNKYKGLQERHAKLAVNSSITLVEFLWDSFDRKTK